MVQPMFDTYELVQYLIMEGAFKQAQAEAIIKTVKASRDAVITAEQLYDIIRKEQANLATKADVAEVRSEMKTEIAEVKTEIAEVKTEISEVKTEIAEVRTEVKTEIAEVKIEVKTEIAKVRTEMSEMKVDIIKWVVGLLLGNTALILGILVPMISRITK